MNPNAALYEADFYSWCLNTAALIRDGKWSDLDRAALAEEIAALAAWWHPPGCRRADQAAPGNLSCRVSVDGSPGSRPGLLAWCPWRQGVIRGRLQITQS